MTLNKNKEAWYNSEEDLWGVNTDPHDELDESFPWSQKIKDMNIWSNLWESMKKNKK